MAREHIGMWLEKNSEQWTARVNPSGWGRHAAAAPLVAWLCGWAVGELFALAVLVFITRELLFPDGLPAEAPDSAGGLMLVVLFIGPWLSFWTMGGVSALSSLREQLTSEERLSFNPSGVTRRWRVGPWREERHLARGELVDVDPEGHEGTLVASLANGDTMTLLRNGTEAQRRELADLLRELFGLARDEPSLADHTPPGWQWERRPGGSWRLEAARHVRRRELLGWGYAALFLGACAGTLAWRLFISGGSWRVALLTWGLAGLAGLLGVKAWRGHQGRKAWEVQKGSLVHIRRGLFRTRHTVYAKPKLFLERNVDSDGDPYFELWVHSPETRGRLGGSNTTPRGLLHLGYWLARRLDVPLTLEPPDLGRPEAPVAPQRRG
jgi:hypothetical protein